MSSNDTFCVFGRILPSAYSLSSSSCVRSKKSLSYSAARTPTTEQFLKTTAPVAAFFHFPLEYPMANRRPSLAMQLNERIKTSPPWIKYHVGATAIRSLHDSLREV